MILEILTICSLITVSPYYDCSEKWDIFIWKDDMLACDYDLIACANRKTNNINIAFEYRFEVDDCGNMVLQHELNHMIFRDSMYCHKDPDLGLKILYSSTWKP